MAARQVILVTGASSGFGALAVRELARRGHTVYAGMRDLSTRNAPAAAALRDEARAARVDLRAVELDVASQGSADAAVDAVVDAQGRLDAVVHNAGHMVLGPTEAFTPEQLHELYDVNVVGTKRVNRAALPRMRGALLDELPDRLGALVPPGADAGEVATAIADVVDLPPGRRPLRTHVDPSRDGSEVVSVVADRIRAEFFRRAGLEDLLTAVASR
jgi:NAD(P)-dependent dehydrogenase (short-subunit alcohol dehydrogenase family)